MPSDNNKWVKPAVRSIDRNVFETWNRDKLTRVRELVHSALKMIETSGQAPETAAQVRAVLVDIDAMLRDKPSSQQ